MNTVAHNQAESTGRSPDSDGGPAFPHTAHYPMKDHGGGLIDFDPHTKFGGMSLRDYFAGQALMGFCVVADGDSEPANWDMVTLATSAYTMADAMLLAQKGTK